MTEPETIACEFCGYRFPERLGRYGCPNCEGEGLDIKACGPCAKTRVTCTVTFSDGRRLVGENLCRNPQPVCPRAPGEGYEKCTTVCDQIGHAEQVAVQLAGGNLLGGHAVLRGHTYACRECQEALFGAGLSTLAVRSEAP